MKTRGLILFLCFLLLPEILPAEEIVFIVHAENPITTLQAGEIRDYYYKRKRQWPNGENVRFIDRSAGVGVRDLFLKNVLKKSSSDIDLFWIGQKLYTGDSAPLRESSDSTILQFISSFKGAIGYVSSAVSLKSKNVKVVKVEDIERD